MKTRLISYRVTNIIIIFILAIIAYLLFIIPLPKQEIKQIRDKDELVRNIAKVITRECIACPIVDKILVGSSILNRMDHPDFPDNYKDVVKNQYAISDTFDLESYRISELIVYDSIRDYNVLYFYNPKTATDGTFIKLMRNHIMINKTLYHNYYN